MDHIELNRRFLRLGDNEEHDPDTLRMRAAFGLAGEAWSNLLERPRVVILAEAGTGKTHELRETARRLRDEGKKAFFLRIEDLAEISLNEAIEVGDLEEFKEWSEAGDDPGYFFLDSVDEARLKNSRYFDRALRRLAKALRDEAPRAHIFISARHSDWRPTSDLSSVKTVLPPPKVEKDPEAGSADEGTPADDILIVRLAPLGSDQVRKFAAAQGVGDVDSFMNAIERSDVEIFAGRPQDLIELIAYWNEHGVIGSHAEMIEFNIRKKLTESNPDRDVARPLSATEADEGAMCLAAALTLTKRGSIVLPDRSVGSVRTASSIKATDALPHWTPDKIETLLSRPIFDEATYGRVRLHHRSVREYLTAQWLHHLLDCGKRRRAVEGLLFATKYGVAVMIPSMKPVAAWLALRDDHIRRRIIEMAPEVLIEHGDPSHLPIGVRSQLLHTFAKQNQGRTNTGASFDLGALRRIADPALAATILELLDRDSVNRDLQQALLGVIWQGQLADCAKAALSFALNPSVDRHTRILSIRATAAAGDHTIRRSLAENLFTDIGAWSNRELGEAVEALFPDSLTLKELLFIVEHVEPPAEFSVDALDQAVEKIVTGELAQPDREILLVGLMRLLESEPHIDNSECGISQGYSWLLAHATKLAENLISNSAKNEERFSDALLQTLKLAAQGYYVESYRTSDYHLESFLGQSLTLRHTFFWYCVKVRRAQLPAGERLTDWWQVGFMVGELMRLRPEDFDTFLADISNRKHTDDRFVALSAAFTIWLNSGRPREGRDRLWNGVKGQPDLESKLHSLRHSTSSALRQSRKEVQDHKMRSDRQQRQKEQERANIANDLRARVSDIRLVDEHTKDRCFPALCFLARRIRQLADHSSKWGSDRWDLLEAHIDREIAGAARDGLMRFWRLYTPQLRSESIGSERTNGVLTGLVGLAIEAREHQDWTRKLTPEEAHIAARYATHELNGLPDWAPGLMEAHPEAFDSVAIPELKWELSLAAEGPEHHQIISALRHGPEIIRQRYRPVLLHLLEGHEPPSSHALEGALNALLQWDGLDTSRFAALACDRYDAAQDEGRRLVWLTAWMCVDAAGALDALKIWLNRADDPTKADSRMISFCNALLGHREPKFGGIWLDFERIEVLRELVPLVYRHVRIEEDKTHEGSYTPDSRDDAESTRGYLLSRVVDAPGRQAFDTLMAFSQELPNQWSRDRMVVLARRRAAEDAEPEPRSASDVATFAREAETDPRSARDLFELALSRLDDLKLELEEGDASEAAILKREDQETRLRVWFANRLRLASRGRYSVASEDELADATRPDLRIDAPAINARVPIELKIADKAHWTYPKLVERLRNQLVGQYMRDVSSGFGIFLLVRRGTKQWTDPETGQRISFGELIERLQIEANSILGERNDINDIRIVGIDLTRRHIPRHAG